jgi:hypothetical protein
MHLRLSTRGQESKERSNSLMSTPNTTRWIAVGLLGLPLYGALSFYAILNPKRVP